MEAKLNMYSCRSQFCAVFFILCLHLTDGPQPAKVMQQTATEKVWLVTTMLYGDPLLGMLIGAEVLNK